ncbi:hypothetical protein V500_04585, partial [Pseudogymnoascus sp. VKM F-4518 (FW-2643)]
FVNDPKNDELIHWSEGGDSFVVLDEDEFAKNLIPELFMHNNYSSFVRQLNMYGFHKRVDPSDNSMKASERKNKSPSEYYNPHFKRGHPNLLRLIKRKEQRKRNNPALHGVLIHAHHHHEQYYAASQEHVVPQIPAFAQHLETHPSSSNSTGVETSGCEPSKDPTSTYADLRRNSNTPVSTGKTNLYTLDTDAQTKEMKRRLMRNPVSHYPALEDKGKEKHIERHIRQMIEMKHSRTADPPPASPASLEVVLPLSTAPVLSDLAASAHGPSTCQATAPRSEFPSSPQRGSRHLQAEQLLCNALNLHRYPSNLASLRALKKARNLEFRPLRSNKLPYLGNNYKLEAAVAYTVGDPVQAPCAKCTASHGPFPDC